MSHSLKWICAYKKIISTVWRALNLGNHGPGQWPEKWMGSKKTSLSRSSLKWSLKTVEAVSCWSYEGIKDADTSVDLHKASNMVSNKNLVIEWRINLYMYLIFHVNNLSSHMSLHLTVIFCNTLSASSISSCPSPSIWIGIINPYKASCFSYGAPGPILQSSNFRAKYSRPTY